MRTGIKNRALRRLKIIEGQIRGLQRMVERGVYCVDIIRQSGAVKQALLMVENLILENHLETHVRDEMRKGDYRRAVRELLTVYNLSKER